jgi:hypothetical protein
MTVSAAGHVWPRGKVLQWLRRMQGAKLIIIHYYRSEEGQTNASLIQLGRGLRQAAALHL